MNEFENKYKELVKKKIEGHISTNEFERFVRQNKHHTFFKTCLVNLMDDKDPWISVHAAGSSIDNNINMRKARHTLRYILRHVEFGLYTVEAENNLIKYKRKKWFKFIPAKNK